MYLYCISLALWVCKIMNFLFSWTTGKSMFNIKIIIAQSEYLCVQIHVTVILLRYVGQECKVSIQWWSVVKNQYPDQSSSMPARLSWNALLQAHPAANWLALLNHSFPLSSLIVIAWSLPKHCCLEATAFQCLSMARPIRKGLGLGLGNRMNTTRDRAINFQNILNIAVC